MSKLSISTLISYSDHWLLWLQPLVPIARLVKAADQTPQQYKGCQTVSIKFVLLLQWFHTANVLVFNPFISSVQCLYWGYHRQLIRHSHCQRTARQSAANLSISMVISYNESAGVWLSCAHSATKYPNCEGTVRWSASNSCMDAFCHAVKGLVFVWRLQSYYAGFLCVTRLLGGVLLFHRLPESHGHPVIATMWHMRSALLAGRSM